MSLAEIFRNEGKEEGKEALANTAVALITKFVAPISEDLEDKLRQQEISTLESLIKQVDEFQNLEEIKQYLK
ncbi:hypothetical protein [Oceanobacillus timonensis]|uniref:hypothetical protein n=1 Tax=Oceanobacillus timonensis TaxID=1926285 RepID=UPI0009BB4F71|nr:hypothetical protein [Oceanobacillus timonensis]